MTKPRVLVVDDEREIREAIHLSSWKILKLLYTNGSSCRFNEATRHSSNSNGRDDARHRWNSCHKSHQRILKCSHHHALLSRNTDKIMGLSLGADDYVTNPLIQWN